MPGDTSSRDAPWCESASRGLHLPPGGGHASSACTPAWGSAEPSARPRRAWCFDQSAEHLLGFWRRHQPVPLVFNDINRPIDYASASSAPGARSCHDHLNNLDEASGDPCCSSSRAPPGSRGRSQRTRATKQFEVDGGSGSRGTGWLRASPARGAAVPLRLGLLLLRHPVSTASVPLHLRRVTASWV
jgi:hypothetical protein